MLLPLPVPKTSRALVLNVVVQWSLLEHLLKYRSYSVGSSKAWVSAFSMSIPDISCNRVHSSKLDICMIGGSNDSTVFFSHI